LRQQLRLQLGAHKTMLALPSAAAFPGRDKSHCKRQLVADSWLLKVWGGGDLHCQRPVPVSPRSVTNINEVVPGTRLDIGVHR
jgi:hypothetical protein